MQEEAHASHCMQALSSLLQLAPCPFWRLEAAIAPGPRLPPEEPSPSKGETVDSETSPPVEDSAEGHSQASSCPSSSTSSAQWTIPTQPELVYHDEHSSCCFVGPWCDVYIGSAMGPLGPPHIGISVIVAMLLSSACQILQSNPACCVASGKAGQNRCMEVSTFLDRLARGLLCRWGCLI